MKKSLVLLSLLSLISCSAEKQEEKAEFAKPVKMITLGDNRLSETYKFPGKVSAAKEAYITFKVAGKLNKLPIREGQIIKKGTVIAQLDQKDYKFAYEKSLASFNEKASAFKRAQELIKNKYISQADFDAKKKSFEVETANLNIARTNLNYTTLKAPFDGRISRVYADNYQNIQVKENIVKLHNTDFLNVKFSIPERLIITKVPEDQISIKIRLDAKNQLAYPAEVYEISTQADEKTQTYEATVRFKHPKDINVFPGMTAVVEATINFANTERSCNCYDIPANAVFTDSSQDSFIWLVTKENRLEKHKVKSKILQANSVTIENGLKPGDKVVIAGVNFLQEGELVKEYKNK